MSAAGPRLAELDEELRYRAIAALDAARPEDRAALLARLADPSWRVRTAAVDRLGAASEAASLVPALVAGLTGGADPGARDAAAAVLTRVGAPAVGALLDALASRPGHLREAAATVLGAIGDRRAVAPLAARLADGDPNVRAAAAEALGRIGGAEAGAALVAALDSDDATLRVAAVEAIAALRIPLPGARIATLLLDRSARVAAYRLLGASEDAAALEALAAGLAERSRVAREAALAALGAQRARRAGAELLALAGVARAAAQREPAAPDLWATSLGSEDASVVVGALAALGWAGGPAHAAAIADRAEDDRFRGAAEEALEALPPSPELRDALAQATPRLPLLARVSALAALARLGAASAFQQLAVRATDPEPQVQAEAIAALGRLGDVAAVAPLAGLLGDDAPTISGLAATALTRVALGSAPGRAGVLAEMRGRADASPSAALYRVLGAVGEAEDVARLRRGFASTEVAHRIAAAGAIAAAARRGLEVGHAPELVEALDDPEWSVRAAAARAIAGLGRSACPLLTAPHAPGERQGCDAIALALRAALRDPKDAVRACAAEALASCRRIECAGDLAALAGASEGSALVAVAAVRALAALGAAPIEVLRVAARHRDAEVVKEAVAAAAHAPGDAGTAVLREAAASARWDVRRAAARAMVARGDPALAADAARLAAAEPDPLVARAFAEAAEALGGGKPA